MLKFLTKRRRQHVDVRNGPLLTQPSYLPRFVSVERPREEKQRWPGKVHSVVAQPGGPRDIRGVSLDSRYPVRAENFSLFQDQLRGHFLQVWRVVLFFQNVSDHHLDLSSDRFPDGQVNPDALSHAGNEFGSDDFQSFVAHCLQWRIGLRDRPTRRFW